MAAVALMAVAIPAIPPAIDAAIMANHV
jgi:hypothetical protein